MPTDAETATSYAALILADVNIPITAEKLQILLKAAGIEDVEPIWANLFAKALEGKNVKDLLTAVTTAGPAKTGSSEREEGKRDGDTKGDKDGNDGKGGGADDGGDDSASDDGDAIMGLFD